MKGLRWAVLCVVWAALGGRTATAEVTPDAPPDTARSPAQESEPTYLGDHFLYKRNYIAFWVDEENAADVRLISVLEEGALKNVYSLGYVLADPDGGTTKGTVLPGREISFSFKDKPAGIYFLDLFCFGAYYHVDIGRSRPWAFVNTPAAPGTFRFRPPWINEPLYFHVPRDRTNLQFYVWRPAVGGRYRLSSPSGAISIDEKLEEVMGRYYYRVENVPAADRGAVWTFDNEDVGLGSICPDKGDFLFSLNREYVRFFADRVYGEE